MKNRDCKPEIRYVTRDVTWEETMSIPEEELFGEPMLEEECPDDLLIGEEGDFKEKEERLVSWSSPKPHEDLITRTGMYLEYKEMLNPCPADFKRDEN